MGESPLIEFRVGWCGRNELPVEKKKENPGENKKKHLAA